MYSVAGTITYDSDELVPDASVSAGKYIYQNQAASYTEITVTGEDAQHSDLPTNDEVVRSSNSTLKVKWIVEEVRIKETKCEEGFLPHPFFSIIKFSMKIRETKGDQMKRKQWMQMVFVASSMILLTGCYQRYQRQSSPKKEAATSQTNTKKQTKKADTKQLYQSVFSDYQKIFATSNDLDAISKLNSQLAKEDRMINSWVIESVINQPEAVRYAFKDLNSDGVDEMIIANQQTDGSYFVTGVYYLKDQKPTLLAEGFVAGHGGARNATTLYQGGEVLEVSWLSGTGRGLAVLTRIEKTPKAATKVQEEEVQVPGSDLNALFGKTDEDKLDLKSFDWQTFDSTPSGVNPQSQEKTPWNTEKSAQLAAFMKTWGEKMGQPNYQKGIAGGDVGPDNLYTLGDNSKMDAIYTDTGQGNAKYRIVERYSNWDKYPDVHSYFFAITDTGEGIVFHSPTTNGGKMYLKPTDNKELQEAFTQILHQ